jgi:hypothetical protein
MRTLASELAPYAHEGSPRIYADANIPWGVIKFMRQHLGWDVFFVLEHEELRRAPDTEHYRLARQLSRTLITLDRDYEDDERFPPGDGAGVIVFMAPDELRLCELLVRADREVFRETGASALPLDGCKVRWHIGAAEILAEATRTPDDPR